MWWHCFSPSTCTPLAKTSAMFKESACPPLPPSKRLVSEYPMAADLTMRRYIRLMIGDQVLVHFKSLDSGRLTGLVTSIVYRNPQFVQQWMFNAVGMAAEGRTATSLVDECQVRALALFGLVSTTTQCRVLMLPLTIAACC